ncbi:MAG TPA: trigger factor [Burkholderiales bacterium]|nr:trigger factor [Burkholderiales bacterium]
MQTSIEALGRLERRFNMAVPAEQIDREVEQRLRKLSRTVRMDGFRPGKVPLKIVAQHYGPQVRSEVVGDAVQKAFSEVVQEQKLKVAGYPRIERKEGGDGKQLTFSATFEIYPEVKLGDLAGATIQRPVHAVDDADVDRTLAILRKQRTSWEPVTRASQTGDRVTVDFIGRIDGNEFPGGKGAGVAVVLGEGRMLPEFESGLAGVTAAEHKSFPVGFPADYPGKEVAGKTANFEVIVQKVETPRLPEIDSEFAKSLGVADGDIAKMREEIRENVQREVKKKVESEVKQKVMQALIDSTTLELPKSLVEIEMQRMVQQTRADLEARGIKLERLPVKPEALEGQARRRVALGLILGELVKSHELGAKPEQVRSLVTEQAQTYEQPFEVVRWVYSEPQRLSEFEGLAVESNVVSWVLGRAKVEDKAISFDELMGAAA